MVKKEYNVEMQIFATSDKEYNIYLTMRILEDNNFNPPNKKRHYNSHRNINVIDIIDGNKIEEVLSSAIHDMMREVNNKYKVDIRLPELSEYVKKQMGRFTPEFDE
jgi:hypothetical protein